MVGGGQGWVPSTSSPAQGLMPAPPSGEGWMLKGNRRTWEVGKVRGQGWVLLTSAPASGEEAAGLEQGGNSTT